MPERARQRRVLVVDDNEDAARSLAFLLRAAGYDVEAVFNAQAALDIVRRFHPDVCLLDINMPGMTGYDLARRIRLIAWDRRPLLATLTAYSDVGHLDKAVGAGFDLHFTKPGNIAEILDQVECSLKDQGE
jgi:two-component system, OmpR family, response regulator